MHVCVYIELCACKCVLVSICLFKQLVAVIFILSLGQLFASYFMLVCAKYLCVCMYVYICVCLYILFDEFVNVAM